jgi:hypothetical protein
LKRLEGDRTLIRFVPLFDPDESEMRELFMTPELHQWLYQSDSKKTTNYKANIRAYLKRYVIGGMIENDNYMKSWQDDIFELRVLLQPRREQTRIFGAFPKPDTFIAIHQQLRSYFGGKKDPKWDIATNRTLERFRQIFPGHRPFLSIPFSNCVVSNSIDLNL